MSYKNIKQSKGNSWIVSTISTKLEPLPPWIFFFFSKKKINSPFAFFFTITLGNLIFYNKTSPLTSFLCCSK